MDEDDRVRDDDEEYIFKKVETEVKTENGESHKEKKLLFAMTSDHVKFRDKGELTKVDLDSIEKMHYGKQPNPDELRLILEDHSEFALPEWILEEFDDMMEELARHAGLEKTEGPEFETTLKDKFVRYTGVGLGIFLVGFALITLVLGGIIALIISPCCLGPTIIIAVLAMLWLAYKIMKNPEKNKQIWEKR